MFVPADPAIYSYLLGIYLGDGNVAPHGRTARFVVTSDATYPSIVDEVLNATRSVLPSARVVAGQRRTSQCRVVSSYALRWLDVFPQHGPGPKHERPIILADWQRAIVEAHPRPFLRGLVQSDGCRTVNRFQTRLPSGRVATYEYPRYFFSNLSRDIRDLFCEACERIGVRWSQSNHRNISVSRRDSVARLDEFIGPKA